MIRVDSMDSGRSNVAARHRGGGELVWLLAVTLVVRLVWMFVVLPPRSASIDLNDWRFVAKVMKTGENPYEKYPLLNWPPFWMESLGFLTHVSEKTGVRLEQCIRFFLIAGDLGLLAAIWVLMRLLGAGQMAGRVLFWGYALNPLLTILTVQHCNFDAFAIFWVTLFLIFTIKFRRGGDEMDWLWSAACLGIGVFTKTFPVILWPVLMGGIKPLSRRTRFLGAGLFIGPAVLALAPLFALSPQGIINHVVRYQSLGGGFGVMSLLHIAGASVNLEWYAKIYALAGLILTSAIALVMLRRRWPAEGDLPLLVGLAFLALFTLGTGYGSQYWFWVFPMLLAAYPSQPLWYRRILFASGVVTVLTNIFDYAFEEWMGGFLFWRFRSFGPRVIKILFWQIHWPGMRDFSNRLMNSDWSCPRYIYP